MIASRTSVRRAAPPPFGTSPAAVAAPATASPQPAKWAPAFAVLFLSLYAVRLAEVLPYIGRLRPTLLLSVVTLFVVFPLSNRILRRDALRQPILVILSLYFATAVLTAPFSMWRSFSIMMSLTSLIPAVAIVLAVLLCGSTKSRADWLAYAFVMAVAAHAFIALAARRTELGRLGSIGSLDANDFAGLMAMALPFAIGQSMRSNAAKRILAIGAALFIVTALLRTGSRGGTVAVCVALFIYVAGQSGARRLAIMMVLAASVPVAWLAAPPVFRERMRTLTNLEQDYNSTDYLGRTALRERAKIYFKEHPLTGVGFLAFAIAEGEYNERMGRTGKWSAPHNSYWQAFAELGFFGGVLFLALIFTASRTAYRVWRKASSPDFHRPEYLAAIGGFSVSAYFLSHAYFWAMFGIVALIAGTALIGSESGVRAPVVTANYRRQPGFRSRHWQRPPQRIA